MTRRTWIKGLAVLAVAAALAAAASIFIAGSASVVDETGSVEAAFIVTSDGQAQPLHRLWPGLFYAAPSLEGAIEVRCGSGQRKTWGYVTPHAHTQMTVRGDAPCVQLPDS